MNRTFAIIKPDAWMSRSVGSILKVAEDNGLHPDQLWLGKIDKTDWARFYEEHAGKDFFGRLIHFMASGPCVLAVLEGQDALTGWRALMGATNPKEALPGTLRALYGLAGPMNAVHGSDSEESYHREVAWAMEVSKGGITREHWNG